MTKVPVAVATTLSFCQTSALPWHISRAPQHDTAKPFQGTKHRGPVELHVDTDGRRKLPGVERCRKRGAHGVVEHSREKSTLHVSSRIEESLDRLKSGFNGAAFSVDCNKAKTVFAHGGGGNLPSTIFQKNEFLSKTVLSALAWGLP
jgi:hypothetical protein